MDNNTPDQVVGSLAKNFKIVGTHRVHSWYAWAMVGIVFGMALGVVYVANQSGQFAASQAGELRASNKKNVRPSQRITAANELGSEQFSAIEIGNAVVALVARAEESAQEKISTIQIQTARFGGYDAGVAAPGVIRLGGPVVVRVGTAVEKQSLASQLPGIIGNASAIEISIPPSAQSGPSPLNALLHVNKTSSFLTRFFPAIYAQQQPAQPNGDVVVVSEKKCKCDAVYVYTFSNNQKDAQGQVGQVAISYDASGIKGPVCNQPGATVRCDGVGGACATSIQKKVLPTTDEYQTLATTNAALIDQYANAPAGTPDEVLSVYRSRIYDLKSPKVAIKTGTTDKSACVNEQAAPKVPTTK